jgi:hypothetical protein
MNTTPPSLDNLFAAARTELEGAPNTAPTQNELETLLVRGRNLQGSQKPSTRKRSRTFAALWSDVAERLNQIWRIGTVRYAVGVSICALCGIFVLLNMPRCEQSAQHSQEQTLLLNSNTNPINTSVHTATGSIQTSMYLSRHTTPSQKKRNNHTFTERNNTSVTEVQESYRPKASTEEGLGNIAISPNDTPLDSYGGKERFERVFHVQTTIEPNTQIAPRPTITNTQICAYCPPRKRDMMMLGMPETMRDSAESIPAGMMPESFFQHEFQF